MVNWIGALVQVTPLLLYVATTVKVAVSGPVVLLTPTKDGIGPVPDTGPRPISSPLLLQVYTAAGTLLVKKVGGILPLAQ